VVVTAEEIIDLVDRKGADRVAREVDVVTTGTFGAMCSSGAFLNIGHSRPRIKLQQAWLNDVEAYCGLAAVDLYIGAAQVSRNDPLNMVFPGEFRYGGGHLIHDLVAGKDIRLEARAYGTDCYPRRKLETLINIRDLNDALLFNPRNSYQNYGVAVNAAAARTIYTYMGVLKPEMANATYSSAGQLSPLLNDPYLETIGLGTRIFLGGGIGYVTWHGTQHDPSVRRNKFGIPLGGAATLALMGDLKQMDPYWLRGASMLGYGVSFMLGVGVPIPLLNEDIVRRTAIRDREIQARILDYSSDYPRGESRVIGRVNYEQLRSGEIKIKGKKVPTASLSSYARAREIAEILKKWIRAGDFTLTEPVASLPGANSGYTCRDLPLRHFRKQIQKPF
jgi:uncharacterized protein (DUF39 family)